MNLDGPANARVLAFLSERARPGTTAFALPGDSVDPYYELGSHPDVVSRLWDELGEVLPLDCRGVVYGRPGLVHPGSGVVLALGLGTEYGLRIHADDQAEAILLGLEQSHEYATTRDRIDLSQSCGSDWFFGAWQARERDWCARSFSRAS